MIKSDEENLNPFWDLSLDSPLIKELSKHSISIPFGIYQDINNLMSRIHLNSISIPFGIYLQEKKLNFMQRKEISQSLLGFIIDIVI